MGTWIELAVEDGTRMRAYCAAAAGVIRSGQGAIVLQEAFGVNPHIRDVTERLAREGYTAIAPELYHRTGAGFEGDYDDFGAAMPHMHAMTAAGQELDLRAAAAWLRRQGAEALVAAGFCMGGRVAVRAAAALRLRAAASFYGGSLLSLRELVASISAPLLLVWGDQDRHIPLPQREQFAGLLRAAGKDFVECTFSAADHGFFCDARPSFHPASAAVAWELLLSFLKTSAGDGATG
ncbi:MAG: dienelactone hydrolase family protein [Terriglobales bacterium]